MNVVIGPHISRYPMGGGGGLLYVSDDSSFTGVNVSFTNGTALHMGGAITLNQGHLACANCTWEHNTAVGADPPGGPHGGAIFNHNIYGSVILESPTFIGNTPSVGDDCSCAGYCALQKLPKTQQRQVPIDNAASVYYANQSGVLLP